MEITVAGAGYVGMANALVLAQHHKVRLLDISAERADMIRQGKSPVRDEGMDKWMSERHVELVAFTKEKEALHGAELLLIATPTDYDAERNFFDTSACFKNSHLMFKNPWKEQKTTPSCAA